MVCLNSDNNPNPLLVLVICFQFRHGAECDSVRSFFGLPWCIISYASYARNRRLRFSFATSLCAFACEGSIRSPVYTLHLERDEQLLIVGFSAFGTFEVVFCPSPHHPCLSHFRISCFGIGHFSSSHREVRASYG